MKNIQFTSRGTGYEILAVATLAEFFSLVGIFFGFLIPALGKIHEAPWILAAIATGSVLFVWSVFRLIEPSSYNRNWQIAGVILVPLYSLVLILAAYVGLGWLIEHTIQQIQDGFDILRA